MTDKRSVLESLQRWVPRPVLSGREPFDAHAIVKHLSDSGTQRLILDLDDLRHSVTAPQPHYVDWDLVPLKAGELAAYVSPGDHLYRRLTHAAILVDRVLIPPPTEPHWTIGPFDHTVSAADIVRRSQSSPEPPSVTPETPPNPATPAKHDIDLLLDDLFANPEIEARLAEEDAAAERHWEQATAAFTAQSRTVASGLLDYWWSVRDGVDEGWLDVVGPGLLDSQNVKNIARDPHVRETLERHGLWDSRTYRTAWRDLMTATGLAHTLGRDNIVVVPGTRDTRDLVEITSRFYTALPYGGALIGDLMPNPRVTVQGGGDVERGAWFDEVMVGLGSISAYLDPHVASELRRDGIAAALRDWINHDLNQVAFAVARGDDRDAAVEACRHRLQGIVSAAEASVSATSSANVRKRLHDAGIWGASAFVAAFAGTLITGGTFAAASAAAGIGFALSGAAGATSASAEPDYVPVPVMYELVRRAKRTK